MRHLNPMQFVAVQLGWQLLVTLGLVLFDALSYGLFFILATVGYVTSIILFERTGYFNKPWTRRAKRVGILMTLGVVLLSIYYVIPFIK